VHNETTSTNLGTTYALLIGIAKYHNLTRLTKTTTDAQDLRDLLAQSGYYSAGNLVLLLDEDATKGAIDESLDWLARHAGSNDTVLIFFSGHGTQRIGGLNPGEYLCPVEADLHDLYTTAISGAEFTRAMRAIRAARVAVFLDACHSGGVGEPKDADGQIIPGLSEALHDRLAEGRGRVIIASCRPDEVSWAFSDMHNSLFTHYLLEGLRGAAADPEGIVRVFDLFKYISCQIPQRKSQHPYFKGQIELDFAITVATGPTPPPPSLTCPSEPSGPGVPPAEPSSSSWQPVAGFQIVPYSEKLRRAMCASLQHRALQALVDENGLGHSVVIDKGSPLEDECRRVIKIGKNYGRPKMEELLGWLRRHRKERVFPDLPPDDDPWWND